MEVSMRDLFLLFVYAAALGFALGAVYDVFRISRIFVGVKYSRRTCESLTDREYPIIGRLASTQKSGMLARFGDGFTYTFVFLGDILFFSTVAVAFVLLIYAANGGQFRMTAYIAGVVGFALYYNTVGRLVITVSEYIAFFLRLVLRYVLFFILTPIKLLYKRLKCIIIKMCTLILKQTERINSDLEMKKQLDAAKHGFDIRSDS